MNNDDSSQAFRRDSAYDKLRSFHCSADSAQDIKPNTPSRYDFAESASGLCRCNGSAAVMLLGLSY